MTLLIVAILLVAGILLFTLSIRAKDLPEPEPVSPVEHLEQRRARIYEGLRDLQFEYRVGKLSEEDYQRTKLGLQTELAAVLAEMERLAPAQPAKAPAAKAKAAAPDGAAAVRQYACPHCKATFDRPMKFRGECGKAMEPAL